MKTYKEKVSECNGIVYNNNLPEVEEFLDKYGAEYITEYNGYIIFYKDNKIKTISPGDLLLAYEDESDENTFLHIPGFLWKGKYEMVSDGKYRKIPQKGVIAIKYEGNLRSKNQIKNTLQKELEGFDKIYEVDNILHIKDQYNVWPVYLDNIITICKGRWSQFSEELFNQAFEEEEK